ncbi:MAG: aldo/keto reductase [Promethearchaeota archaeon]|jgi:diketogulonate reductase-like aldo/keto reductase
MELKIDSKIKLNNGVEIPLLGLGTWQIPDGNAAVKAIRWAIGAGYRHFDTAAIYRNEKGVGQGIKIAMHEYNLKREDIFVTTKLWISEFNYDTALKAFSRSLRNLNFDYVDLYLLHWPEPSHRKDAWKALEKIYKEGKSRSIGVSNFYKHHLEDLLDGADVVPTVNQVEFTPYLYLKDLKDFCDNYDIKLEAYSPLTRGRKLDDRRLVEIAQNYNKTTAQILIRWGLQHNVIEIPKSMKKEHIIENSQIFDFILTEDDMVNLNNLDEKLYIGMWNPTLDRWK